MTNAKRHFFGLFLSRNTGIESEISKRANERDQNVKLDVEDRRKKLPNENKMTSDAKNLNSRYKET